MTEPKTGDSFHIVDAPKARFPDGTPMKARKDKNHKFRILCIVPGCKKMARTAAVPGCRAHAEQAKARLAQLEDAHFDKTGFRSVAEREEFDLDVQRYHDEEDLRLEKVREEEEKERQQLAEQRAAAAAAARDAFQSIQARWLVRFRDMTDRWHDFLYRHRAREPTYNHKQTLTTEANIKKATKAAVKQPRPVWTDAHPKAELAKDFQALKAATKQHLLAEKLRLEQSVIDESASDAKRRVYRTCLKTVNIELEEVEAETFEVLIGAKRRSIVGALRSMYDKYLP